jgi:hypothetical protein
MHTVLDIDAWARDVAAAESIAIRQAVRDAMTSGASGLAALSVVRRRLARLTDEQRAMVVAGIGLEREAQS